MSFIEDLRSLVESTQQIGDRRPNAAKTLTKIEDMATGAAKDRVVDALIAQNLGLFPLDICPSALMTVINNVVAG